MATPGLQVLSDPNGVMDSVSFQTKYQALSLKMAIDTARKSGLDPSDPRNVVQTMQSGTYQNRIKGIQDGSEDPSKMDVGRAGTIQRSFTRNVNPDTEISAGFRAKAYALSAGIDRRAALQAQLGEESDRLSRMVDFDKEAYTNAKLAELQPTASIDKAIMDIRNRALVDKAKFYSDPEITSLPFALQQKVIGERMGMYTDQINDLADLRSARLEAAKAKIKSGLDSYNNRIEASKTRISSLEKAIQYAKDDGADEQEIAQLRIDHAKEIQRLNKERDKGGTGSTSEELMANALIQRYYKTYGVMPEGEDLSSIKTQAKMIVRNNKGLTADVTAAGGEYSRLPSRTVNETVQNPDSWWNPFDGGTSTRSRQVDPFEAAGYGYPPPLTASGRKRLLDLQKAQKEVE